MMMGVFVARVACLPSFSVYSFDSLVLILGGDSFVTVKVAVLLFFKCRFFFTCVLLCAFLM